MRRRDLLIAFGGAALAPQIATAQQGKKVSRIGILSLAGNTSTKVLDAFRRGLRDLGYFEGHNISIEYRLAAGDFSRLPAMVSELVRLPVDVIVIDGGTKVAQIAHEATLTIPIVGPLGPDPLAAGLAASLAHPGGNVTGHTGFGVELSGKRLQLLKEAFPGISRMAALWSTAAPLSSRRATEEAARALSVELRTIEIATPDDIRSRFEEVAVGRAEAFVVLADPMFWNYRARIITLAAIYRTPAIYPEREYVDDGGLLGSGAPLKLIKRL
jgi:putative ABC transport system substrate-binding protein